MERIYPFQNAQFGLNIKNIKKTWEKPFYKNTRDALCKKRSKKHQIFEKTDNFEIAREKSFDYLLITYTKKLLHAD